MGTNSLAAVLRQNDLGQVPWVFLSPARKGTPSECRENRISVTKNQVLNRSNLQNFFSKKGVLI